MTQETYKTDDARATLYHDGPDWQGAPTATIGEFKCNTAEAGAALLQDICNQLASSGVPAVLGPMNGDTWHSYRLVTESDGSPPFLMEPQSKAQDVQAFQSAGFETLAKYFSARTEVAPAIGDPPAQPDGLTVTNWNGTDPEAHFAEVYALSTGAFAANAFYKPIDLDAFLALYMPFVPLLRPELIFTARDDTGQLQGYLFGIPNYGAGAEPDTVILKTYASLQPGLGHVMSHAFHTRALDLGFANAIHALMHDDNRSAESSRLHGAKVFRRYALMGRRLG